VDLQGHFRRQPLLHWVEKAQAEPDQPFFVILDEMNLARVEYYFSDFLSILETREKQGDRVVSDPLVPASLWAVAPSAERWGALSLPDNLYLVGTVNMDETTYPFSRKVLDRANTIEMNEVRLDWPEPEQEIEPLKEVYNDLLRAPYVHARDLHPAEKRILAPAMQWLGQVNQLLREVELPLGYRVRDEVAFYLLNRLSIKELISEGEALDRQLVQKILPRVQGSAPRVGAVLPKLMHLLAPQPLVDLDLEQVSYADLYARLGDPRRKRLPFPFSLEKLLVMYRRFEEDGFTSFWL
jgi:5-methylcytosine-specific restriction enzyme B